MNLLEQHYFIFKNFAFIAEISFSNSPKSFTELGIIA